ncbi:MAG: hypothetical protein J5757_03915 [Lachnospiraceae bacterium]|nr:hypothetical protein [Lachnospiraceae bacterium]
MRTENEMMERILSVAKQDDRARDLVRMYHDGCYKPDRIHFPLFSLHEDRSWV